MFSINFIFTLTVQRFLKIKKNRWKNINVKNAFFNLKKNKKTLINVYYNNYVFSQYSVPLLQIHLSLLHC